MHTNELLRQIDDSLEMGSKILACPSIDGVGDEEASRILEKFCWGIRTLTEEVYGSGRSLLEKFEERSECTAELVEEGMSLLRDLRILVEYSGEFSS